MVGFTAKALIYDYRNVWHGFSQIRSRPKKRFVRHMPPAQPLVRIELGPLNQAQLANLRRCAGVKESTLDPKNRGFLMTAEKLQSLKQDPRFKRLLKERLR